MIFVSSEDRFLMYQSDNDYSEYIEGWNYQQCYRQEDRTFLVRHKLRIVHTELYKKYTKDISKGETSRIAHENLLILFSIAPDVMIKKRYENTH